MILDLIRGLERIGVIPGGVFVHLLADHDIEVTGFALPVTSRVCVAFAKVFVPQ